MNVTGHLQVVERRDGRRYFALWRDASGVRGKRLLGKAWVEPDGETVRGAVRWRAADGHKPDDTWLTPSEAQDALRVLLEDLRPKTVARTSATVTFQQACDAWLLYLEHERRRKPSTLADYRRTVKGSLVPAFGARTPVADITTERIDAYRERLLVAGRLSPRTIQKNLVLLHGIMKRALRRGWIDHNPVAEAERVLVRRSGDFNVLQPEQVAAIAGATPTPMLGALIVVAAFTGLRTGELRSLRWQDVDFSRRSVFVRRNYAGGEEGTPKSQRVRSVPLVDQAGHALAGLRRRGHFTDPDDLVFCDIHGRRIAVDVPRHAFYAALEATGMGHLRTREQPIVFHDLRHTFGTLAVQAFPLSDVKAFMGHQDISTTMIYVHHVPRHDAADRLTALLNETGHPSRD